MARGEAFAAPGDVDKVLDILTANPDTVFWIPTRAWRNASMRGKIERKIMSLPNARVLASTDIYTSKRQWAMLARRGWSTMFFGDDNARETPIGEPMHLCAKTHKGLKGACATCVDGCFSTDRVNIHLKKH
jgi:hypothetical protein